MRETQIYLHLCSSVWVYIIHYISSTMPKHVIYENLQKKTKQKNKNK